MIELARLLAHLAALDPAQTAALARRYQKLALEGGAYVLLADGAEVAIPPILTPVALEDAERSGLASDAAALVAAVSRVSRVLIEGADPLGPLVLAPLTTHEREVML